MPKNKFHQGVSFILLGTLLISLPRPGLSQEELAQGEKPRLKSAQYVNETNNPDNFSVVFTFIGKPASFSQNLDKRSKKLEIIFYDVELGNTPSLYLRGGPILNGRVDVLDENLTQVQGLTTKDVHRALKVTLQLEDLFPYEISSEHNVITLSRKVEEGLNWKAIGIVAVVVAAAGTIIYFMSKGSGSSWTNN